MSADIDWAKFSQGPISDSAWSAFRTLVHNSREYLKEKNAARDARHSAQIEVPGGNKYAGLAKRQLEASAKGHDSEWHAAEYRAFQELHRLAKIGSDSHPDSPDHRFSIAIINAVGGAPALCYQERGDYSTTAMSSMDAAAFLELPPDQVAQYLRAHRT